MPTISIVLTIRNEKEFIKECIMSVMPIADEYIIIIDERSNDKTEEIVRDISKKSKVPFYIERRKQKHNTDQRNYGLKKSTKEWILFLDGDEIMSENIDVIKDFIKNHKDVKTYSFRGHHFIYHLGYEDSTEERHYWSGRLVKRNDNLKFTGKNHPLLNNFEYPLIKIDTVRIYHVGYIKQLYKIIEKYERDKRIKQIHNEEFLTWWKDSHIFGRYPVKTFDVTQLPKSIKKKFYLEKFIEENKYEEQRS